MGTAEIAQQQGLSVRVLDMHTIKPIDADAVLQAVADTRRIITVEDLIRYRLRHETLVQRVAAPRLPTRYGEFQIIGYRSEATGEEHIALVMGEITPGEPILVR